MDLTIDDPLCPMWASKKSGALKAKKKSLQRARRQIEEKGKLFWIEGLFLALDLISVVIIWSFSPF